jgi:hypothetical protein
MIMLNNRPLYVGNVRPLVIDGGSEPTPPTPPVVDEVQIGNQIWKTFYLDIDDGQGGVKNCYNGDSSLKFYTYDAATRICSANYPGWHVAVNTDYNVLASTALDNTDTSTFNDLFGTAYGGTDKYGLQLRPMYLYLYNGDDYVVTQGRDSIEFGTTAPTDCIFTSKGNTASICHGLSYYRSAFTMTIFNRNGWLKYGTWTDVYTIIRLVKDV